MKRELISQYRAALSMLRNVVVSCPEILWDNTDNDIAFWQLVYHTLYFTDLYLADNAHRFVRWSRHRQDYQKLGRLPADRTKLTQPIYTKNDLLGYISEIDQLLIHQVKEEGFKGPSGFEWLVMNKLESHLYNIRHLQHHTGQLIERLHQFGVHGIPWIIQFTDGED
ncbi:DinB family protein [Mucilaginibacter aquaedulcis]|uniref:DinB family protein n=1 Tax=Mucilaginibacter aquaedulcis TaxID=1187081 RepID=UPI0025B354FE|nr:DinB family protein [Mucilaginibacter aquaedulcis]MDN3548860.1 hypothetical protein [Mucilaginibacter aquaedulcis]